MAGRINYISVFGEVTIKMNQSSQFTAKNFTKDELAEIDKSQLQCYIEPTDGWTEYRGENNTSVNFTWELREFNQKQVRIKLNFSDPLSISPLP